MRLRARVIEANDNHRRLLATERDAASLYAAEGRISHDSLMELSSVDKVVAFFSDRFACCGRLGDGYLVVPYRSIRSVTLKKRASASISIGDRSLFEPTKQTSSRMLLTIESRRRPLIFDFRSEPSERVREAAELIRRSLSPRANGGAYDEDTPSFLSPLMLSRADEIAKLAQLRSEGVLSDEEFEAEKARILNS